MVLKKVFRTQQYRGSIVCLNKKFSICFVGGNQKKKAQEFLKIINMVKVINNYEQEHQEKHLDATREKQSQYLSLKIWGKQIIE